MSDVELTVSIINILGTTIIGLLAIYLSRKYSKLNKQNSEDAIFHTMFRDFNERYDDINDYLDNLKYIDITWEELKSDPSNREYKNKVLDYLNLCAEELFWKNKGRIPREVWDSWEDGMMYWYNNLELIKEAWDDKKKDGGYKSYYLESENELFNKERRQG